MDITIAEKLRPFSHRPGTKCLIPGSLLRVEVFPLVIRVDQEEYPLDVTGPVQDFTVQLDLEKGCVWVWGTYKEGYRRYRLWSEEGKFKMTTWRGEEKSRPSIVTSVPKEKLSLGSHKKQDWDLVIRRSSLSEILPHWLRLGQWMPIQIQANATFDLMQLFHAGFEGILSPKQVDPHLGYHLPENIDPLEFLPMGAHAIKSLFISHTEKLSILPALPPEFHAGRYTGIELNGIGTIDMEWSKKTIRRMILRSKKQGVIPIAFQKDLKRYRLRTKEGEKGVLMDTSTPLNVQENTIYLFDRFER